MNGWLGDSSLITHHSSLLFLSILIFAYWVAMLIQLLLNLAALRSLDSSAVPARLPLLSIIVPARNEAASIESTVRAFLGQDYPNFEVVVVDDCSSDGTAEVLKRIAGKNPALRVIRGEETPPLWLGKPWALHQGAAAARGELLLFVDADVRYEPAAVRSLVSFFLQSRAGLISVLPRLQMHGFWENLLMPWLPFMALVAMPVWLANRSTLPRLALGGGPGNLLERATYDSIGGHAVLRSAVIDDIGLVRLVRRSGRGSMVVRGDHLVSLRMYRGLREIIDGFSKNIAVAMGHRLWLSALLVVIGLLVHVMPFIFAVGALVQFVTTRSISSAVLMGTLAAALIVVVRLILFGSLRFRMDSAVLGHPLAAPVFLFILARSSWNIHVRKQLVWRGRAYSSDWVRFGGE